MKKWLAVLLIGCALIVVSAIAVTNMPKNQVNPKPAAHTTTAAQTPPGSATPAPGTYTDYSADLLQKTSGTKVLFFHATWCPQCRALDKSIRENTIPSDVTIFKVDYDSNQALRQKYGVTIQTTLVTVDDAGNKIASFVAYDQPTLQSVIEHLLQ